MSTPQSNPDQDQRRCPKVRYWVTACVFLLIVVLKMLQGVDVPGRETGRSLTGATNSSPESDFTTLPLPDEDAARLDHPAAVERRLLASVRYLAADELEGRGIGTTGIELAANYIADEFRRAKLQTAHYQGMPFQRFAKSTRIGMNGPNELRFQGQDEQILLLRRDFTPLSLSGSGRFPMPVVFVGYGITAPEYDYDDYAPVDVKGKTVLVLRHMPRWFPPHDTNSGTPSSEHARLARKVSNAIEHGAAAVVFVTDSHTLQERMSNPQPAERQRREPAERQRSEDGNLYEHDQLLAFTVRGRVPPTRVPIVQVLREHVEKMVHKSTGLDLALLEEQIDQRSGPQSRLLSGLAIQGNISVGRIARDLKNVVATLNGVGPLAEETIVIGAHYDHLGHGNSWASLAPTSRAIHNGADDNASGTAMMLELARQLAARDKPLKRRVMFLAFTAEESGLVGSQYYSEHPLVPLEQTIAMLNFDMVGYLRNSRLEVFGTRSATEFEPLLDKLAHTYSFELLEHPAGDGPSDHAPFHACGVPVLHFFTGFHDHYHRPSDDYDRLNYRGMRRITALARDLIIELANGQRRPHARLPQEQYAITQWLQSTRPDSSQKPRRVSLGLTGHVPNEQSGYVVGHVAEWGLAQMSGIRQGDRIVEINSRKIVTEKDYSEAVAALRPNSRFPLLLWRGQVELEIDLRPQ